MEEMMEWMRKRDEEEGKDLYVQPEEPKQDYDSEEDDSEMPRNGRNEE